MSIKSTKYITRGVAESRIIQIIDLIQTAEWGDLRQLCSNDEEWFKEDYINFYNSLYNFADGVAAKSMIKGFVEDYKLNDPAISTDEKIKSNDKPQKEEVTEQKSNSSKNKKSKKER